MNVNRELLAFLRKQYPVGTRIRLDSMQDPYAPVEAGTTGKLDYIDDAGQFHMKWDNGRVLALIPGVDSFTVLPPELSMTKLYMPLTAELYEPDVYGNMQEEPELLTGHDLTAYEDHIRSALVKYRMPEEVNRGIMHWYDTPDSVNDKVRSVTFSVERRNGKLWGMEQIRIIKEMRDADVLRGRTGIHVRPRFMCWENVPGAFSSGQQKGDDFRVVLEETLGIGVSGIHVPENHPWGWRYSGAAILGDFVSLCWRVLDAQYWGVPQSRKRIFLVADLGTPSSAQILFEPESLPGHSP